MILFDLDLNGVQQVGFAQTAAAPDEQGIVGVGGVVGHGLRGGQCELVAGALDEVFKGEIIPAAGQLDRAALRRGRKLLGGQGHGRGGRLFGADHAHLGLKAQHAFKSIPQQI